jgi:hypothetical protein
LIFKILNSLLWRRGREEDSDLLKNEGIVGCTQFEEVKPWGIVLSREDAI